jgi:multiple sugar transport system ATP-binding protein
MNLFEAIVLADVTALRLGSQIVALPQAVRAARPSLAAYAGQSVVVGLRPEHLPAASADSAAEIVGDVELVEALGSDLLVHFTIDANRVVAEGALDEEEPLPRGGDGVARVDPRAGITPGSQAHFAVDIERVQFFDPSTGLTIR